MTPDLVVGFVGVVSSVALVLVAMRARWVMYSGSVFVMIAAFYHGLTEVVQSVAPGRNVYRTLVSQGPINRWIGFAGAGLFCFTIVYLLVMRGMHESAETKGSLPSLGVTLGMAIPAYIFSLSGRLIGFSGSARTGVATSITLLTMSLAGYALAMHTRQARRVWVVIGFGMAVALIGSRTEVVVVVLVVWGLLAREGEHLTSKRGWRNSVALVLVVSVTAIGISAARAVDSREGFRSRSALSRVNLIREGLGDLGDASIRNGVMDDFVYRFDGNAWPALVLDRFQHGGTPVGATTLKNGALLAVPSAIYRGKLGTDLATRNEEFYIDQKLYIPHGVVDWIPTHLGVLFASSGPLLFLPGCMLFGGAFGLTDRWLRRRRTGVRHVLAVGVLIGALSYEQGLEAFPLALRAALILAIVLRVRAIVVAPGRR